MNPTSSPSVTNTDMRQVPLAIDAATFRTLGHALVDQLAELLSAMPAGRVQPGESPSEIRRALELDGPLPELGTAPGPLLEETARRLFAHSTFNGHPRFMGYITSSPAPIGMLADLLAAAVNPNCAAYSLSPAATEIEAQTVRWIAQFIGCPAGTSGLLVSGGNMANMVGFWAARAAKASWDVRAAGVAAGPRMRAYASAETHTWIQKAADLSGLGTDSVRFIPTGADLRMSIPALEAAIATDRAAGDVPFLIAGTAGSVSTGAVDDLPALAAICKREQLWFHVDGAYGGFAAAVKEAPADLRALALADSVAVDPHKWLYAPLEAGCALVRDQAALMKAFSYHPPYYHLEDQQLNYVDLGPQNSRGFRALKVWLVLRHAGAAGYRRMISDDIALARHLADVVRAHAELEFMTHDLSITTYRCVPPDLRSRLGEPIVEDYLNALNKEVLAQMQSGGEAFVSNAVVQGRYVLRACVVNFNTRVSDIEAVAQISARMGREIDAGMRVEGLK